jgi:hypothetical protein
MEIVQKKKGEGNINCKIRKRMNSPGDLNECTFLNKRNEFYNIWMFQWSWEEYNRKYVGKGTDDDFFIKLTRDILDKNFISQDSEGGTI